MGEGKVIATENMCPHCGKSVQTTALRGICPECMLKAGLAAETGEVGPDGAAVARPPSQLPPKVEEITPHFPQLEILEPLGRGGMGAVYKARQPKLDRFVALKILSRSRESGITDTEFAARFQQEARALARLNHPDIVAVYDFGEAGGYPYLLMEYVDGLTLRQLLQTKRISPEEALTIVPKICEALQFAHDRGIVHRDIKPENILLDKQGRVKIADFGIAKILGTDAARGNLTGAKDVIGTPHYMAPEQVEKPTKVDHRADIYSLGVVFYEMLTGELPLGKFQVPSKKVQLDVRLDEVVLHALEKEPERRYQHAGEVKSDVETIAGSPSTGRARGFVSSQESAVGQDTRPLRRHAAVFSAILVLFAIVAAVTSIWLRSPGQLNASRGSESPSMNSLDAGGPSVPPVIVHTMPESGAAGVDPALSEIRITFSEPMRGGGWSWAKWDDGSFPIMTGQARFLEDERTCVLPVRLQPGKVYALWLNSEHHQNFKNRSGQSAIPYLLIFETRK